MVNSWKNQMTTLSWSIGVIYRTGSGKQTQLKVSSYEYNMYKLMQSKTAKKQNGPTALEQCYAYL